MTVTVYDQHAGLYVDFVDAGLRDAADMRHQLLARFEALVGERVTGATVLDTACGEGYLSRHFARLNPRQIVGVDLSGRKRGGSGPPLCLGGPLAVRRFRRARSHGCSSPHARDAAERSDRGGFALERIEEPVADDTGLLSQVPRSLLVIARRA